jgi:hypothetical protein
MCSDEEISPDNQTCPLVLPRRKTCRLAGGAVFFVVMLASCRFDLAQAWELPFFGSEDCQVIGCALAGSHESRSDSVAWSVRDKERVVGSIQGFLKPKKDAAAPYVGLNMSTQQLH